MDFLKIISLRGPNIWTYRPVLEAWVDIGYLEDYPSNTLPGFNDRLKAWLPTLVEHRCSYGERGGFLRRLEEGTWPGHILEHVTLELQNLAGMPGGFGRARETSTRGVYKVVVRAWHEEITKASLYKARDLLMAAINDTPFDVTAAVAELHDMADSLLLGPSTACIVDAAADKSRGIPAMRLNEGNLVQLGYGCRQRRIWTAESDRTSAIAEGISRDKDLTKQLLQSCGVPVPEGSFVRNAAEAWEEAESIGVPVVVKPYDGNHGRGVFTNLHTQEQVEAAYEAALNEGSGVIVERFIEGGEHRLLVVNGKLIAANKGEEAWITGDGRSTVSQLIDTQLNSDPRRGDEEEFPLNLIRLENEPVARLELERQGFTADSVLPQGKRVLVLRNGNMAFDVTDEVHPDVAAAAVLASQIVGLDIAGVDLVTTDVSQPLEATRGAIVEVNAGPGLLMHLKPAVGEPRPVGEAIVNSLFAANDDGRIPVVGITGTNGKSVVAHLLAWMLQLSGKRTGLASSDGLCVDKRLVETGDRANWRAARKLLMNPQIEAAVLENDSGVILGEGLAYDRCLVGVVTNIDSGDHLGDFDINSAADMYKVMRTQMDVVLPHGVGVLNSRDPIVASMAELCDGEVIFFGVNETSPILAEHRARGKRSVFVRNGMIVLAKGREEIDLLPLSAVPLTAGGRIGFQVENVLAAVGAAWGLGLWPDIMRAGLESFNAERNVLPGRFSLFEKRGAKVIIDQARNDSAREAVEQALQQVTADGQNVARESLNDLAQAERLRARFDTMQAGDVLYLHVTPEMAAPVLHIVRHWAEQH